MKKNIDELENGKISRLIASYSLPAILGMLVMASYNIVDRIFVGRGVGALAITGVHITMPVFLIILGIGQLVGMGAMSIISIRLGEKNKEEAEKILGNAFFLIIVISLAISAAVYFTMAPLISILGGTGEAHVYSMQYMSLIVFGMPLQLISFSMNGIIRSQGSPYMALSTMLISGILNIILNPIFIMVFHMGVKGSALATIIAQFVGAVWVILYFAGNRSYLKLKLKNMAPDLKLIYKIFSIGVSPFVMQVAGSFIVFLFNKELLIYGGDIAIAAMAVGNSIVMIIMMPIYGLNQGIQPIIGYNYGARHIHRVKETLIKGIMIATIICLAGFFVIMLFASNIVSVFNSGDSQLIDIGSRALKIFLLMLPLNGFQIVSWAYFQAVGKPMQSLILTLAKQILLIIPLVLILPHFFKLDGIWMSGPIADFISACIAAALLLYEAKNLKPKPAPVYAEIENG